MKPSQLANKVIGLAAGKERNFLDLARTLYALHSSDPVKFKSTLVEAGIAPRSAYCLMAITRTFGSLAVTDVRLQHIGWTKLNLLVPVVNEENCDSLLHEAETRTVKDLEDFLASNGDGGKRLPVVAYLSPIDHESLEKALKMFGAVRSKHVLHHREEALAAMVSWVLHMKATVG